MLNRKFKRRLINVVNSTKASEESYLGRVSGNGS